MKNKAIEQLTHQAQKKLIYYLQSTSPGKALLIFDHGLGDAVEFLSLYETLKKDFPQWNFNFGFHPSLEFDRLHPDAYPIHEINDQFVCPIGQSIVQLPNTLMRYDTEKLLEKFKYVFCIQMYDARHPYNKTPVNISKLDLCKVMEFGYPDNKVVSNNYTLPFKKDLNNENSKRVIVHVGGHTDKAIKNPTPEDFQNIWYEIEDAGYEPFDVHIVNTEKIALSDYHTPAWLNEKNSLRYSKGNMDLLINTMLKAKYIIGVLSGPLHMGHLLYGAENCLGLEGKFKIHNYICNTNLQAVPIHPYTNGTVLKWLESKK